MRCKFPKPFNIAEIKMYELLTDHLVQCIEKSNRYIRSSQQREMTVLLLSSLVHFMVLIKNQLQTRK